MRRVGISTESAVRMSVYHDQVHHGIHRKLPGKPVGVIEVGSRVKRDHNPLKLTFTVSRYRNDLKYVVMQGERKDCLSGYAKSLFDSCFKNW